MQHWEDVEEDDDGDEPDVVGGVAVRFAAGKEAELVEPEGPRAFCGEERTIRGRILKLQRP